MFIDDTIAAIATAPGEGGIGIIRISGSNSLKVAEEIFKAVSGKKISEYNSRTLVYGNIFDGEKRIDEVLEIPVIAVDSVQEQKIRTGQKINNDYNIKEKVIFKDNDGFILGIYESKDGLLSVWKNFV